MRAKCQQKHHNNVQKVPVDTLVIIELDPEILVHTPLPDLVRLLKMNCGQNLEMRNVTQQQIDQRIVEFPMMAGSLSDSKHGGIRH